MPKGVKKPGRLTSPGTEHPPNYPLQTDRLTARAERWLAGRAGVAEHVWSSEEIANLPQ